MSKYVSDKTRWILEEELDDYDPPSDEEIEEWLEKAPHPSEAVEYPDEAAPDGGDPYDPREEFADE
jgi:hypothetical protein